VFSESSVAGWMIRRKGGIEGKREKKLYFLVKKCIRETRPVILGSIRKCWAPW
jgi:Flp pilus assembly CpaF family ATPase